MKTCLGCGKQTNLVVSLGGVFLCRDDCYPAISLEIEGLRRDGKTVDVTRLARQRLNRRNTGGSNG